MRAPLLAALLLFAPALAHAQEPARWAVTAAEPTTLRLVPPAGAAVTLYDGAVPVARVDRPAALRLATGRTYQVVAHRPGGVVASFALRADGGVIVLGWSADDTLELRSLHRTTAGSVAAPPPAPRRHVRLHAQHRPMDPASFGALVAAIEAEAFSSDKLALVRAARRSSFTTAQLARVVDAFAFDGDRLSVVETLHDRVVDPENAFLLGSHLTFSSTRASALALFAAP